MFRNGTLPTRVMDVGSNCSTQNPRLVTTNGKQGSWVALSYCWGDSTFVLRNNNIDEMCKGEIILEDFPSTLRDAIFITRSLGMQYLWIDALCIMQDSTEDWSVEAARMGNVYGGATLTIAAVNSPSTYSGILLERPIPEEICRLKWGSPNSDETLSVFLRSGSHYRDASMKGNPLNGRCWTPQESLLSP